MDWKDLLDSLGIRTTWWQWRFRRWREQWEEFRAGLGTRAQHVGYEHKLCATCGGLVDRDTAVCPRCQAPLENWRRVQLRRAFGMIVPQGFMLAYAILILNLAVAALTISTALGHGPLGASLYNAGALAPDLVFHGGQWWRLITYAFLHGSIYSFWMSVLHLGFNMSALSQVGPVTENQIGRARFWCVYLLCALGGAAADLFWHAKFGTRPLVIGASGAIFGLIGFGLTYSYFYGSRSGRHNARIYLQWAIYSFAFGFLPGIRIDNVCHAGGFLTGALLGILIEHDLRHGDKFSGIWRVFASLLALAAAAAFVMVLRAGL